ncbi:MAG TPA: type II toxin-antitoxin system VapC family toxin [Blastocatellia bacterium]|nr:type II toxin-antitoxin system VapC family toxin [Blastocatellia bacterium]
MKALIVDTNVASFIFKGDTRADLYTPHLADAVPGISFMTLAEMEQWSILRNWGAQRHAEMLRFIKEEFVVVNSDEALCRKWAEVRGATARAGRHIEVSDAWVAATALLYDMPLVTHNPADFEHLSGLTVITEA